VSIGTFAVRHSRAALLVSVALVAAGAIAAYLLPSSIYPPLEFPRIVIIAHSGTLPPQSMMLTVTRPIETAVMEVPGIRRVRSRSIRGAAEISAQFDPATKMEIALQQVQNRVAEAQTDLPADTELTVERLTPAVFPILILSMSGPLPTPDLNDFANYVVKPELARVPGAGRIEVLASDTREIEVVLDPDKLAATGIGVGDVADALKAQNELVPVGRFAEGGQQHLSLASGLWTSLEDIAAAPILVKGGATVRVSDIGVVTSGSPDRTLLITGNGRDAVSISISQQIGANILSVKQGVERAVTSLQHSLPSGIHLTKVYDLAEFVNEAIANVRDAILIGGFLAVVVLIVFLRNLRLTLIAAVTLPLAIIPTFLFMYVFNGSLNLMSLGGLAVAIGLVIDDAVVVVENIHRRAAEGSESVVDAVGQLVGPLVSSTLTTVVVFAPLGLLSGVIGQFFRALSMSLSVAVLLSLGLSLTVVPMLARWAFRRTAPGPLHGSRPTPEEARVLRHARPADDAAEPETPSRLARGYGRALNSIVHRPAIAVLFALALGGLSVGLFFVTGTGFLPKADEGGFVIDYLTPAGSALQETDRQVRAMERVISETPEVASYSRRTGSELGLFATAQNSGDILVRLKRRGDRSRSSEEVIAAMRPKLQEAAPLAEIEFVQLLQDMLGDLEGAPTPIEIKIFGDDPDKLESLADPVEHMLEKVDGVVDVVGMQRGSPEVTWTVDPVAAGRAGMTVAQVADQMSASWLGKVATDLRLLDRRVPVRVRLDDRFRFDPARLPSTLIRTPEGGLMPVSALAHPVRANGQAELLRENLRQMAVVSGRLEGRDMGSAVAEIESKLRSLKLPVGYTYEIGGQYASQQQAFRELLMVFGIATVLVFVILVVQFRAWTPAVLILLAAPLSLGGALALLVLTGTDLNVSSAMGIILLIGLVVKNGIMLLEFSERLHERGEPFDTAIAHAGRIRLRPILMTTFCTLFGLLPLALGLGAGAELQKPLALAVIGGLALSTPVTLLAIPGLYGAIRRTRSSR
jgi:hydrophobe/amphiphile efflux-1 (HAE1) family protein